MSFKVGDKVITIDSPDLLDDCRRLSGTIVSLGEHYNFSPTDRNFRGGATLSVKLERLEYDTNQIFNDDFEDKLK